MKHTKRIKRICLFTATGCENLGDELITQCEIDQFRDGFGKDIKITIFSHNPSRTKRFLLSQKCSLEHIQIAEYFPNALTKKPIHNFFLFWKTLGIIRDTDQVFIGGGGLLYGSNEEGHSPLRLWWLRARLVKLFRKPLKYLSIGISATKEELAPFAQGLFNNAEITVRDQSSAKVLQDLGYEAEITPDPVLTFVPKHLTVKKGNQSTTIALALRAGFLPDSEIEKFVRALLKDGYKIVLLPHSLHPDDESSHDGYYLQKFLYPGVEIAQSVEHTLHAYSGADLVIAMRLHSMILSHVMKKPFVALSYGKKTDEFLKSIGYDETIKIPGLTAEKMLEEVKKITTH